MFGQAYDKGRLGNRMSGGGGSMKPNNNSESLFGILLLLLGLVMFASCTGFLIGE
jgi:hypothetical protein